MGEGAICMDDSKFDAPLPVIGLYITLSCVICMVAMGIDTIRGLVRKRLWFPCKFFPINASTLTLLAVACKLPADLATPMPGPQDQLTKLSGTVFICVFMCFSMPSLAMMGSAEIASNMVALSIIVITVEVDVCTQLGTGLIYKFRVEHAVVLVCMLILLGLMCSSALATKAMIGILEKHYEEKAKAKFAILEKQLEEIKTKNVPEGMTLHEYTKFLREDIRKEWLMAHTGSPQYVLARSVLSTGAGALTWVCVLVLLEAEIRSFFTDFCSGQSSYMWANWLVLISQTLAVLVGSIAPAFRWFSAPCYRMSDSWKFRVENFWVERLEKWKKNLLPRYFRNRYLKKVAYVLRNCIMLDICIFLQKAAVKVSKAVCLASALLVMLFRGTVSDSARQINDEQSNYVLHLPGENFHVISLYSRVSCNELDKKTECPSSLKTLLSTSNERENFKYMRSFCDDDVEDSPSGMPSKTWTLPAVTLVAIAVSLSRFNAEDRIKRMVNGLSESMEMMMFVEKRLDTRGLIKQRRAAEITWSTIYVNRKWLGHDLANLDLPINQDNTASSFKCLTNLRKKRAPSTSIVPTDIIHFLTTLEKENKHQFAEAEAEAKAEAVKSLNTISKTILDYYNRCGRVEELLDWMERSLADIVGHCLKLLPKAIHIYYRSAGARDREIRVRKAAFFLRKTEDTLLKNQKGKQLSFCGKRRILFSRIRRMSLECL